MKKSFKKMGMLALAAGMTLTLAACGNDKKDADASAKKTVTVSVDKGYKDYINDVKGKFEKDNKVKVVVKTTNDALSTLDNLKLDGPAGKAPDVMMAPFDRAGVLGKQGQLATVKLPSGRYNQKDKDLVTFKGKQYGQPAVIETLVMYYNKDLVSEVPKTFKDLEAMSKDPKYAYENDKTKNVAFLTQWTNFYNAYGVIKAYDGYIFGKNNTDPKDIGLNNQGGVEGITYMTDWFKNVWPKGMQSTTSNENFITDQFTKGKSAVVIDGPWMAAKYKKSKINFGVASIPTLPNGEEYQAFGGGKAWVVSNYSKNKSMSQKFAAYLANDNNQQKFYKATQEVPANENARAEVIKNKDDQLTQAVVEQFKSADPMPNLPEMAEVWAGAENLMVNSASGKQTPKQAADKAVKQIKESIQQKYKD
ncbi:maltose maltodextrin ABC transporter binding protein [Ligilactobacillus acidipiscis DSM 15836]|uniref:Maltodextrin-binding protein n=2 Tax=Ligilactobacillus acidipiscis TaxID=89059 RepID=A0ABR5PKP3_9LACO|nr:maltose maltodextrin ABC transporter binding protein [Ligilactobacillus acidipiscis DSM 15836]GAW63689.1 sugar ABC transporter substrate-binding protein [Ligilactobacillus acidipiscis]GEN21353.1 sugar ABC transporter substrate-binding protein [Ligilactobacillus acidipiscis]